jgi:hypothetical protein
MKRHTSSLSEKSFFYFVPFFLAILLSACGGGGSDNGGVPKGAGSPEIIGSSGGTRTSDDGKASIEIPAGALSQDTTISVTVASNLAAGNIGAAYHFEPDGTTFSQPVTISISYDEATLSQLIIEKNLRLGKLVNGQWQLVAGSTVDIGSNKVSGKTTSFSIYGIIFVSGEVTAPILISPINDQAIPQNDPTSGCRANFSTGSGFKILFDWEDSTSLNGIAWYHFSLKRKASPDPIVVVDVEKVHTSEFAYSICDGFIPDLELNNWEWSVRAVDNEGTESLLSTGQFHFEPCALSGGLSCTEGPGLFAPGNVSVTPGPGDGEVTLNWQNVDGADSYNLYFSKEAGVTKDNYTLQNGGATRSNITRPFVLTSLSRDTQYHFVVTAVNSAGESPESLEVIATPLKVTQPVNLTGKWSGAISGNKSGQNMLILELTQVGIDVSGSFACSPFSPPFGTCHHDTGIVSGKVNGTKLTGNITFPGTNGVPDQSCAFVDVNVSKSTISGTYSCSAPISETGSLSIAR